MFQSSLFLVQLPAPKVLAIGKREGLGNAPKRSKFVLAYWVKKFWCIFSHLLRLVNVKI
jgi:hypothetical protein